MGGGGDGGGLETTESKYYKNILLIITKYIGIQYLCANATRVVGCDSTSQTEKIIIIRTRFFQTTNVVWVHP